MIGTKRLSGCSHLGPRGRTSVKASGHGSYWLIPKATSFAFSVREYERLTVRPTISEAHAAWIAESEPSRDPLKTLRRSANRVVLARDHLPMETGLVEVLLHAAKPGGVFVATAYTVFAEGRLQIHVEDGSDVEFDCDWMDVRFVPS
jgi:hypothetical protein